MKRGAVIQIIDILSLLHLSKLPFVEDLESIYVGRSPLPQKE